MKRKGFSVEQIVAIPAQPRSKTTMVPSSKRRLRARRLSCTRPSVTRAKLGRNPR